MRESSIESVLVLWSGLGCILNAQNQMVVTMNLDTIEPGGKMFTKVYWRSAERAYVCRGKGSDCLRTPGQHLKRHSLVLCLQITGHWSGYLCEPCGREFLKQACLAAGT